MTAQAQIFEQLLPRWRASLPPEFPRPYFDSFVLRMRPTLEALVGAWMARRTTKNDATPESWTKGARTKRNLEAMRTRGDHAPPAGHDRRRAPHWCSATAAGAACRSRR
jgi:hypothetical protein